MRRTKLPLTLEDRIALRNARKQQAAIMRSRIRERNAAWREQVLQQKIDAIEKELNALRKGCATCLASHQRFLERQLTELKARKR